jgi:hypothetical protein
VLPLLWPLLTTSPCLFWILFFPLYSTLGQAMWDK